jgi:cell division protease FtsH
VALYVVLLLVTSPRSPGAEVSLSEFNAQLNADPPAIQTATLRSEDNRVDYLREGQRYWVGLPANASGYLDGVVNLALKAGVPLTVDQQRFKQLVQPATLIVPALIIVAAFVLFFLLMRSGADSTFTRAAARRGASGRKLTFADVAGVDEAVDQAREIRDYLTNPAQFRAIGAQPPRGILLVGPPGTGKTLLARAVAGEAGVPFFSMSGTDFVEMYQGVGAARVRDLFRQVRESAPAILFIDELDAMGKARSAGNAAGQEERDQTLNQLLVELDGFDRDTGVVLIGATNRPDVLDPALLRRGRFDRQIIVDRPDRGGRRAILDVHAANKSVHPTVDLDRVAGQTAGFTGSDLASVMNEAALLAARRHQSTITESEIEEGIDRILSGSEGRVRVLSPREKQAVAYHEAGHAVVGFALPSGGPVTKMSIVGRGRDLGFTRIVADDEKAVVGQAELEDQLALMLGGRAAEELALGQATTAAKDDLRQATALARRMVCELGMSELLGRRALGQPPSGQFLDGGQPIADYSAEVAADIDREIGRLVGRGFGRATEVLLANRPVLDDLATELVARETLRARDLAPFASRVSVPQGLLRLP